MNKAEKFVNRTFKESLKYYEILDAFYATVNVVCNKFKDKKIPPEYENALTEIKVNYKLFP